MTSIPNPFRPSKFEFESRPLIWVSPRARRMLRDAGSFFVLGARGSGKTSLLKTLDTNEFIENKSLQNQLKGASQALGVYIRIPDLFTQVASAVDWERFSGGTIPNKQLIEAAYISCLVETAAVEVLLRTLVKLRIAGYSTYKAKAADAATAEFVASIEGAFVARFVEPEAIERTDSLEALANAIERARSIANQSLVRGDWTTFSDVLKFPQPGFFLARAAKTFIGLARGTSFVSPDKLRVKVLLDECDYLTEFQQTIVNTLVRNTKFPLDWVVAFVPGEREVTATLSPTFGLTASDRNVVDLDIEEDNFESFCQHVCSYRIFHTLKQLDPKYANATTPDRAFVLRERLGVLRANDIIHHVGTSGYNKRWNEIEANAKDFGKKLAELRTHRAIKPGEFSDIEITGEMPNYWQAYLIKHLKVEWDQAVFDKRKRPVVLATLRRKQRAALLHMATDLQRTGSIFFGYYIVISLADNCIRDFLDIMAAIFDEYVRAGGEGRLLQFCRSRAAIEPEVQNKALSIAGQQKYLGFQQRIGGRSRQLTRLIDGLGELTHQLQVANRSGLTGASERGIFVVRPQRDPAIAAAKLIDYHSIETTLRVAQQENLLIFNPSRKGLDEGLVFNPDEGGFQFRLHRRFAPKYNFSFRGALERVNLPEAQLSRLLNSGDELGVLQWAREVAPLLGADDSDRRQPDLFWDDVS